MASCSGKNPKINQILAATSAGNLPQIKELVKELDDGNGVAEAIAAIKDSLGRGLFHVAALRGRTSVCKYFLEELKFDVDGKDGEGYTPFLRTSFRGHLSTMVYLIENGADPAVSNRDGSTALHYAAQKGNIKIISLLLSKGVDVNVSSEFGTPLQLAAMSFKQDALKVLLDHGANPNRCVSRTHTPLVLSLSGRSLQCTEILLKAGADPNGITCGKTPLAYAAKEGIPKSIKCLLKAGADPNITDDLGLKPIEIAGQNGNHLEVRILFPVTSPVLACPDWSVSGIMKYARSEEFRQQMKHRLHDKYLTEKAKGDDALARKDYAEADYHYTQAIVADSSDAALYSKRSLCAIHQGLCHSAWADAQKCMLMSPRWPEGFIRGGAAMTLYKEFDKAAEILSIGLEVEPQNKDLQNAYQEAVEAQMKTLHV